ncbi:hypothetical protein [Bacillus sp. FJAT-27251]|nr:hypothetical protein [Bacillus sp. FJAT-27251]
MPKSYFITPEERFAKKKRAKAMIYAAFFLLTIFLSAVMTIAANQL